MLPSRAAARPRRRARQRDRGVTLVEFALMAPFGLLLLMGTVVGGIFAMNYMQLQNAVRDGARAAAVCGGAERSTQPNGEPLLPNGAQCTDANLTSFISSRFQAIPGDPTILQVTLPTVDNTDHLAQCQYGKTVEVTAKYDQPFYLPLIGRVLSNNGSGSTFTIHAQAEATCEE
jgi:Flp pilus assembly protein TadG